MHLYKAITLGLEHSFVYLMELHVHVAVTETLNLIISVSYRFMIGNFIHFECLNLIFPKSHPFSVSKCLPTLRMQICFAEEDSALFLHIIVINVSLF